MRAGQRALFSTSSIMGSAIVAVMLLGYGPTAVHHGRALGIRSVALHSAIALTQAPVHLPLLADRHTSHTAHISHKSHTANLILVNVHMHTPDRGSPSCKLVAPLPGAARQVLT
jgi:hypothetical protein